MIPTSQLVNKIGKYLYKHIDGADRYKISGNQNDIWFTVLYQVPEYSTQIGRGMKYSEEVYDLQLNINVTTYRNKIRVNLIEVSPEERTLGHFVYMPEQVQQVATICNVIIQDIAKKLNKVFADYNFIY